MEERYPFAEFLIEDKTRYPLASEKGYYDPYNHFRIGDSGGFIMNIRPGKFINTYLFTEMADYFEANDNKYTNFKEDSLPYRQLRKREAMRRRDGYSAPCWQNPDGSIENVHISGDYYNFLNYTRMERTDDDSVKSTGIGSTGEKVFAFPKFIDAQYWTHNIYEFAKNNGFHLIIVKTRRGGFSYMNAARAANAVNLRKHKVFINVAADNKYLTKKGGLTDFAVNTLRFYEEKTMFKRGIYSSNVEDFRLGFRLPNGVESEDSWQSSLISVSANNNPDCAIGKDAIGVNVEELSTMQNFNEFMTVTEPAMTVGDITTGMLVAWGTATATNMQVFEENFYAPGEFNFMSFENVWDKDARNEICGFFKSYAWGLEGSIDGVKAIDEYGNSNIDLGIKIAMRSREAMKEKLKLLLNLLIIAVNALCFLLKVLVVLLKIFSLVKHLSLMKINFVLIATIIFMLMGCFLKRAILLYLNLTNVLSKKILMLKFMIGYKEYPVKEMSNLMVVFVFGIILNMIFDMK